VFVAPARWQREQLLDLITPVAEVQQLAYACNP
jgi:hypothetical protein